MANTTEELAVALKEQDILAVLDTIIDPKVLPQAGKDKVNLISVTKATDLDAMGAKVALIDGTTAINFDEIILDGDRATVSDIDDPNAAPATLERFVSIAGLRHGLTQFGKVMATTYEHLLGNPTKDDQILSSKKDGTRSWIDAPSGGAGGTTPAEKSAIAANTAKVTYDDKAKVTKVIADLATTDTAVTLNTAKVGITQAQADAITDNTAAVALNTAKETYPTVDKDKVAHITITKDLDLDTVSTVQHLHGTTVPADTLGKDGDTYFKVS